MRFLGVDLGSRRIGLAISDKSATLATPVGVLEVSGSKAGVGALLREINTLLTEDDSLAGVVVGLPRALSGEPNQQTEWVAVFVEQLRDLISVPVFVQDERLTSYEAETRLAVRQKDWQRRKNKLDAAAAAVILQDYLDERRRLLSDPLPGVDQ